MHQAGVDAVPLGGGGDDVGERPHAGLGRSREEAGGGEQQEHEATAAETRRFHGECVTYHISQEPYASPGRYLLWTETTPPHDVSPMSDSTRAGRVSQA